MLATQAQQRSCCIGGKKAAFSRAAGVRAVRPSVSRRGQRSVVVEARVRGTPTPPISELVTVEQRPEKLKLPAGYHWYETMLVLQPLLSDEDRDKELAKFEAFLNKEECLEIGAIVRPRARLAYPMDRHKSWEGIYVLYTYAARRPTAKAVQLLLSSPEAGSEDKLMRHITFCKY